MTREPPIEKVIRQLLIAMEFARPCVKKVRIAIQEAGNIALDDRARQRMKRRKK